MFRSEEPDFLVRKNDYTLIKIGVFRQSGGGNCYEQQEKLETK